MTWLLALGSWLLKAMRWLVGSREGRIALLAVLAVATFLEYGHRRFSAGVTAERTRWEAKTARANADAIVAQAKRDTTLEAVSAKTKADTHVAVGKVERDTHERAEAIDRVPVHGGCAAPVGLPRLDAAVDQANAAAGH